MLAWHTMKVEQAVKELNTDLQQGLSVEEARRRLDMCGYNELKSVEQPVSSSTRSLPRLRNILVIILGIAVVLSVLVPALLRK